MPRADVAASAARLQASRGLPRLVRRRLHAVGSLPRGRPAQPRGSQPHASLSRAAAPHAGRAVSSGTGADWPARRRVPALPDSQRAAMVAYGTAERHATRVCGELVSTSGRKMAAERNTPRLAAEQFAVLQPAPAVAAAAAAAADAVPSDVTRVATRHRPQQHHRAIGGSVGDKRHGDVAAPTRSRRRVMRAGMTPGAWSAMPHGHLSALL